MGKTTMTKSLGAQYGAQTVFEWARPYLETVGAELTVEKMTDIFYGQASVQQQVIYNPRTPLVVQDTDLFSTVGYWRMWDADSMPSALISYARLFKSDLYLIMSQEIPFEPDPLRYGGVVRESADKYWIDLCEGLGLPYVYITGERLFDRRGQCMDAIEAAMEKKIAPLRNYERKFNG